MRDGHYVIDAHCHIYPDKIAKKASVAISDFYDGIPHTDSDVHNLLYLMDRQGIDFAVVNSAAMNPHQVPSVNRFLLEEVAQYPQRLAHVGSVHPDCSASEKDEAFQYLADNGFHGLKLHPDMLKIALDDPRMMDLYARCREAGLPVLLHTGDYRYDYSNPNRAERVLQAFPDLIAVGAHFGGWSVFTQAARQLHGYENLYVDCSSAFQFMNRAEAVQCFAAYGTGRVMFGTDYPVMVPEQDLGVVLSMGFDDESLDDVLWRNAVKVYGLKTPWME